MDVAEVVRDHYSRSELETVLLGALHEAGVDTDHLSVADLAPADHLHAGGLEATRHLLAQLQLTPDMRLLDVGCGLGGPGRAAAAEYGCSVLGVDLSSDFIEVGRNLTEGLGLAALVRHQRTDGDLGGLADASFDRAMMVHVGMNVPDKAALFADVRRVLRPGGLFGLFDQMRVGEGQLTYPLPWAEDDRGSFVETPDTYVRLLTDAGFVVRRREDRTAEAMTAGTPRALSPAAVFGPRFLERYAHNREATSAGILAPTLILAVAEAPEEGRPL